METENNVCSICYFCENKVVLTYQCRTCKQPFCTYCKPSHDILYGKKNHVVEIFNGDGETFSREIQNSERDTDVPGLEICSVHPSKLIEVHCLQCRDSVCLLCFTENHNGHQMLYLNNEETQTKLRQDLQKLNDDLKLQIDRLDTFSQQLASKRIDLVISTDQECARVDEQVELICDMVKILGEEIKSKFSTTKDKEREKLETLIAELESSNNKLKSDIKNASVTLEGNSITKVLNITYINQKVETEFKQKDLVLPDLEIPYFKVGDIVKNRLLQQLGICENKKEQSFTLDYNVNKMVNHAEFEIPIQDGVFTYSGVPWIARVTRKNQNNCLVVDLYSRESESKGRGQRVEYLLTLINKIPSNCMTRGPFTLRFTSGFRLRNHEFIPLSTLKDPSNGFTDDDGKFSMRVYLKPLT